MHFIVRCFEDVPLVKFMYSLFTHMPGGVTIGISGLYCCVPCLLSKSLWVFFLVFFSFVFVLIDSYSVPGSGRKHNRFHGEFLPSVKYQNFY